MRFLNKNSLLYLIFFFFGFGTSLIYLKWPFSENQSISINNLRTPSQQIRQKEDSLLISPLLLGPDYDLSRFDENFSREVREYIAQKKKAGEAKEISFFAKNLTTGIWVGVDENQQYSPASLMKVPILIAALKHSELNPGFLDKKIYLNFKEDLNQREEYKPAYSSENKHWYTIRELLDFMIKYSDNNATIAVLNNLNQEDLVIFFSDIGLPMPTQDTTGATAYMSAQIYSRLFRLLYNATYLNKENSVLALNILLGKNFPPGISSGVASSTPVAQKFGEREVRNQEGQVLYRELHDCGIVYKPGNPYTICIMTQGKEMHNLENILSELSRMLYNQM